MSDTEPRQEDKVNSVAILAIGLASAFFIYASMVGLRAMYRTDMGKAEAVRDYEGIDKERRNLEAIQLRELARDVDEEGKKVVPDSEIRKRVAQEVTNPSRSYTADLPPVSGRPAEGAAAVAAPEKSEDTPVGAESGEATTQESPTATAPDDGVATVNNSPASPKAEETKDTQEAPAP